MRDPLGAYNKPLPLFSPNTKQKHSSDPVMASKKPAKKAPAKKAPVPKKAPVKAAKPAAKTTKKVAQPAAKKVAPKKVIKPVAKVVTKKPAPKKVVKSAPKAPVKAVAKPSKVAKVAIVVKVATKAKAKAKTKVATSSNDRVLAQQFVHKPKTNKNLKLTPFLAKQRQRLLELKDTLLDAMRGVARDNLHSGSDTSAFGMHQADAGSDAYDRDFALSMLSKEQGSLYEIDEALKRVEDGTYGVCDLCQKPIKHERLEALPFTRYTVDCQASLEKNQHHNSARPQITSLFGLTEEEAENEEEDTTEIS